MDNRIITGHDTTITTTHRNALHPHHQNRLVFQSVIIAYPTENNILTQLDAWPCVISSCREDYRSLFLANQSRVQEWYFEAYENFCVQIWFWPYLTRVQLWWGSHWVATRKVMNATRYFLAREHSPCHPRRALYVYVSHCSLVGEVINRRRRLH